MENVWLEGQGSFVEEGGLPEKGSEACLDRTCGMIGREKMNDALEDIVHEEKSPI